MAVKLCTQGPPPTTPLPISGALCLAPGPITVPLSPSGRPRDLVSARRSELGGSGLGGAQLWLLVRPPLKKRLTRVLERCSPGGAPRDPWPSGFFFRFSSGNRAGGWGAPGGTSQIGFGAGGLWVLNSYQPP